MKMSAFFLGTKRIASWATNDKTLIDEDSDDEEGGGTTLVYQLARASDLAVNDDPPGGPGQLLFPKSILLTRFLSA